MEDCETFIDEIKREARALEHSVDVISAIMNKKPEE